MGNKAVNFWLENKYTLNDEYQEKFADYKKILEILIRRIEEALLNAQIKGIVKGRVKTFDAFHRKLLIKTQQREIRDPFQQIKDMIGIRIVVPFVEDVKTVEALVTDFFQTMEVERKSQTLSISEFGYDSTHILIKIPAEILDQSQIEGIIPCEIQIRTILQDAWAEVEHELVYKTTIDKVEDTIRKKLIALNATLSLADTIFQEIRDYQKKRYNDIQTRHNKILDKVSTIPEKTTKNETFLLDQAELAAGENGGTSKSVHSINSGLNDLFVEAMNAHVENRLDAAIGLYTQILAVKPIHYIYNHRGLVYFALSEYDKAIDDFTRAIEMGTQDTRVFTNRGLTYRMLHQFDKALSDFNKSLDLNPLWPDTFYGRSLTYYDMGNIKDALENCDKAINLKPSFKQAVRFKQFLMNMS